jgi:TPR repeat protein
MIRASFAVLLALAAVLPVRAKDLLVAADGSGDFMTLLPALKAAAPGDVVVVKKAGGMVGMVLAKEGGSFIVKRTVPGSPSEAAGVKAGERVLSIDEFDIAPLTIAEAVARIKGPVGGSVVLKVAGADGADPRDVSIVRGNTRWPVKNEADKLAIARSEGDDAAAFELASSFAEGGLLAAESALAFDYFYGKGTSKDPEKAARWAQAAAKGGDVAAERLLGALYAGGTGIQKNTDLALYWFRAAAEKEDSVAMENLASMYETGFGVAKDPAAALAWARRAAAPSIWQTPENLARAEAIIARGEAIGARDQASIARDQASIARDQAISAHLEPAVGVHSASNVSETAKPDALAPPRSDIDDLPAPLAADPKAVALVIGVERYRDGMPKADFAAADARLTAEYFKRVLGVQDENLAILLDDRATKNDLEKNIERWLPNHVEKGSKVYVYYSGHGAPDPAKGDAYLVPYDADPTYIAQTGYSLNRLYAQLGKLPADSVLVVMDSCFSGAGGRSVMAKGARPLVNLKTDAVPANVTALSASTAQQISNTYQEKGHGLFTYFFLKGLKEKGDVKAAFGYLGPEVSRVALRQYNSEQTPQWRDGK